MKRSLSDGSTVHYSKASDVLTFASTFLVEIDQASRRTIRAVQRPNVFTPALDGVIEIYDLEGSGYRAFKVGTYTEAQEVLSALQTAFEDLPSHMIYEALDPELEEVFRRDLTETLAKVFQSTSLTPSQDKAFQDFLSKVAPELKDKLY